MTAKLIAIDYSGSTGGSVAYHSRVRIIVDAHPDAELLHWDTRADVVSRREFADVNQRMTARGGTEPECVARYIRDKNFNGHLIFITDGEVGSDSVRACDAALGDRGFEKVECHIIDSGGANMSCVCPFTRTSPSSVHHYRSTHDYVDSVTMTISAEDIATLDRLDAVTSVAEFESLAPALERVLSAKTMETEGNMALRDKLLALRRRIVAANAIAKAATGPAAALAGALAAGDVVAATAAARRVTDEYYNEETDWSAVSNRMIAMCEGALHGTFSMDSIHGAITSDRVRRAGLAPAVSATAVPLTEGAAVDGAAFQCPIALDTAHDVVILVKAEAAPLLAGLSASAVDDLLDCPLNIFNPSHAETLAALRASLDHAIGLDACQTMLKDRGGMKSPLTRAPIVGALCLSPCEEHCKASTWTLSQVLLGGKAAGNPDLWFACVWLMVERGMVPHLEAVKPQLEAQMRWRLANHTTFAAISGLPEFPTTRLPVGVALWYVLASPAFMADPKRDLIRLHVPHLDAMQSLQRLTGYALPAGVTEHANRVRVFLQMLTHIKHDRHTLPMRMKALQQRAIATATADLGPDVLKAIGEPKAATIWVPLDGPVTAEQVAAVVSELPGLWRQLDVSTLVGLAALVDPSKSAGDIDLPFTWTPPRLVTPDPAWKHLASDTQDVWIPHIQLSTCRPRCSDMWQAELVRFYGTPTAAVKELMPNYTKDYAVPTGRFGRYLTATKFSAYLGYRYPVLPAANEQHVRETLVDYAAVTAALAPAEFTSRYNASCSLPVRRRMEVA